MPAMRRWVLGLALVGALLGAGAGCSCSDERAESGRGATSEASATAEPRARTSEGTAEAASDAAAGASAAHTAHKLTGTVRTYDGRALPGAVIRAEPVPVFPHAPDTRTPSETTADAAGAFALPSLEAGDWALSVSAEGALATYAVTVRVPERERFDIVLPRGSVIEGTVIDETTRAPVGGARVRLSGHRRFLGDVRTSADGRFRMALFDETDRRDDFRIDAPGYASVPTEDSTTDVNASVLGRHEVKLVAQRGHTLSGRVVGPDGPIAGARVTLRPDRRMDDPSDVREATTDAAGSFAVEHLVGDSWVLAEAPGWLQKDEVDPDVAGPEPSIGEFVDVTKNGWTAPDIEMRRRQPIGRCTIRGRVVDEEEHGIAGVDLVTHHRVGAVHATSEGDGSFYLAGVPTAAEGGRVGIRCPDDGEWEGDETVETRAGAAVTDATIFVSRIEHPHVRGRVLAPDRTPVAGARVVAVASSELQMHCFAPIDSVWVHGFEGRTAADGTFDVQLRFTGPDLAVVVEAAPYALSIREMQLSEAIEKPVEVVLEAPITLAGRAVRKGSNVGVAGLSISLARFVPSATFTASGEQFPYGRVVSTTAPNGSFRVEGLRSSDLLLIGGPGWIDAEAELDEDAPGVDLRVEMEPALEIAGRAQFADESPCPGVEVARYEVDPDASDSARKKWEVGDAPGDRPVRAAEDGTFFCDGLTAGQYWIEFTGGSPQVIRRVVGPVDAGTRDLHVELVRGVTIGGRVAGPDGRPVDGVTVTARADGRDGTRGEAKTDRAGAFAIGGLDRGPHVVEVKADGYFAWTKAGVRADGDAVDVRLDAGLAVAGVILTADGTDGHHLYLVVEPVEAEKPAEARRGETDYDGKFRIAALTRGRWRIRCADEKAAEQLPEVVVEAGNESLELRLKEPPPEPAAETPADDGR